MDRQWTKNLIHRSRIILQGDMSDEDFRELCEVFAACCVAVAFGLVGLAVLSSAGFL